MIYCSVFGKVQTDNRQTESDFYEPTMQHAPFFYQFNIFFQASFHHLTPVFISLPSGLNQTITMENS